MQNLLSLPTIILIVASVLALVVVVIVARRLQRRQPPSDGPLGASSALTGQVDYTSLPLDDDPSNWRDRFTNLSLASKILVILVPVLAILGILVLVLTLLPKETAPQSPVTLVPAETASLKVTKADVVRADPEITLSVIAEATGLEGVKVRVELLADGAPIPYLRPEDLEGAVVRRGRVEIEIHKLADAPPAQQGVRYTVRVSTADGLATSEQPLVVDPFSASFYAAPASPPTSTPTPPPPTPTATLTETPPAADATPTPTVTPTSALPSGTEATIGGNGGNVRAMPALTTKNRIGGVDAGNKVQLIEQTPNGKWYRIRFTNTDDGKDLVGWISATLIPLPAKVKAQIPVAKIVSVFKIGAVYERPDTTSKELDRVNIGEVVELKQKTADGTWYEVETMRGSSGWVRASLLGIPAEVAAKVSVAP
ncbi:MAG: SH3 domain-containing protein [Chloroflexales bacterium]